MCLCALGNLLDLVAKKWNLLILEEIGDKKRLRHKDLNKKFGAISPSTLASALKSLEAKGLIKRKVFTGMPLKVEYSLSEKGSELRDILIPLSEWAQMNTGYESNCKCKKESSKITETDNTKLNKVVEASLCACTCMPMMAAGFLFSVGIF